MLLGDNERFVIKCVISINSYPADAPNIPLKECIPLLIREHKDSAESISGRKDMIYEMNKGRSGIRLLSIKEDNNYLFLLFQYANKDVSDPAFTNIKTGGRRVAKKQEGEGLGCTAHLIIKKEPNNKAFPNHYDAMLEEVPGITRAIIGQALNSFLSDNHFGFHRGNNKKELKCRPMFKIDFAAEKTLGKQLSTGKVCGLVAVRSYKQKYIDSNNKIKIEEQTLRLSTNIGIGNKALQYLKDICDTLRGMEYTTLRISHRDINRRTSTNFVSIDKALSLQDIAAAQLAERDKVILATPIEICQEKFHDELISKMVGYFNK
ncbi:hypothetical protein OMG55_003799 [Proteus mirabilis]|nr:hypothetical protein [Proteus mirabilis]EKW6744755.1 hypothetical protein [Proteus mirabilis]